MASWTKQFEELTSKNHKEQAIWWLNGFWEAGAEEQAETIWDLTHLCIEIDSGRPVLYGKRKIDQEYGCDLDEMKSHVFLEKLGETLTVRALRKRLAELDIDNNKRMALSEYLLAKYTKTPQELVNSPQGGGCSPEEMANATKQLDEALAAVAEVTEALEAQKALLEQQKKDEEAAKAALEASVEAEAHAKQAAADAAVALEAQQKAEAALKKAENELRAAVEELEAQQKAFDDKKAKLEATSTDENLGIVKRNRAKNELEQMLSEDPLPLRKAKITQGAALKRAEKARKPFAEATKKAEADKAAAEQAVLDAAAAKAAAEAAAAQAEQARLASEKAAADLALKVEEANKQVAEAKAALEELKNRKGTPFGKIWWMEREMAEAQKFMPRK